MGSAMNTTTEADIRTQVSHDEVSRRAEELWRQYGCPEARDEEIWLEAERQLRGAPLEAPAASERVHFPGATLTAPAGATGTPFKAELMETRAPSKAGRSRSKSTFK